MNKFFTYEFDRQKYTGYRLIAEKSNFDSFKKIKYEGFEILYQNQEIIHFKIDIQVIRKLKIKKLDDKIRLNINEKKLSLLFDGSEEKVSEFPDRLSYWSNVDNYQDNYCDDEDNKKEQKRNLINQSRKYSQKVKQYQNKGKLRK